MGIMPMSLRNRPEMDPLGHSLNAAFNTLSSSRHYSDGSPLPITITEMYSFCQLFEISDLDERQTFVGMMQRLDGAYLADVAKRNATKTNSEVVNDQPMA